MNQPAKRSDSNFNGTTPLRPHQVKAVKAIKNQFKSESRTKYIAACGTGKTMVGLHVAETLNPRSVIVFLPSLALIRQTLIEWSREKMFNGNYINLFVCSDQTITDDLDPIVMTEKEFGHPITTDSISVRRFLKTPSSGIKVIYSTYNSARVLVEGTPAGFQYDFAVMDEAHRTAGPAGKPFGLVLDDTKLPIKKRLFLTATPRLYKVKKSVLDSDVLSYSMDSVRLYGTTAARLPFKEAVELDLIAPYEILASVITSAEVDRELLEKELVFNNKPLDAKRIANLVSIRDAVEQHDIKKIFTFHGRIEDAREFIEAKNPPIQDYLPDFKIFHISGEMPMEKRNRIMEEFRLAECAIISNAKVLSEGIDVPSVDMVAFMCPKKSTIDIVQTVGRVSRNHPGKKVGYVLLPLFLDQQRKETEDEAFDRTEFAFMWNVFKAMKSEDDTLDLIIKNESMKMGEHGEGYVPDFKDKIRILGSPDTLEAIGRSIKTKIIETVGESFDYWIGLLQALIKEQGEYGTDTVFRGKRIGIWISRIRKMFKLDVLTEDQISRLEALNFVFDEFEYRFDEIFDLLASYKTENGHCLVKNKEWYKGRPLGRMISNLRSSKRNNKEGVLSEERIARLDSLGMVWNPLAERFIGKIKQLIQYKKQHNHLRVSQTDKEYKGLGNYITKKRMDKRMGTIPPGHERILTDFGLDWEPLDQDFMDGYNMLLTFRNKNGHCRVPDKKDAAGDFKKLSIWCRSVRQRFDNGTLKPEKIRLLRELNFDFNPVQADFEYKIPFITSYKTEFGHLLPQQSEKYKGVPIGEWISRFREARKMGRVGNGKGKTLTDENIKRLDALGMVWDLEEYKFQQGLKDLTAYKEKFGDCLVSRDDQDYKALGSWVQGMRLRYRAFKKGKRSRMRAEWITVLNAMGFDWSPKFTILNLYIRSLALYRKEHGHFNVPSDYKDPRAGKSLGRWTASQVIRIIKHKLPPDYKRALKQIGFPIDSISLESTSFKKTVKRIELGKKTAFEAHFPTLLVYLKHHDILDVTNKTVFKGVALGRWFVYLRRRFKTGHVNPEQISRLDQLGFPWTCDAVPSEKYLKIVLKHIKNHGTCSVSRKDKSFTIIQHAIRYFRSLKNTNEIPEKYIKILNRANFVWNPSDEKFEKGFKFLVEFKQIEGHCNVPRKYKIKGYHLGSWVSNLRLKYQLKSPSLTKVRIKRLEKLSFKWTFKNKSKTK